MESRASPLSLSLFRLSLPLSLYSQSFVVGGGAGALTIAVKKAQLTWRHGRLPGKNAEHTCCVLRRSTTWPRRPLIDAWRFFFFPICFRLGPRVALVVEISTSARYSNLVVLFTRSSGFNSAPVTIYLFKTLNGREPLNI